MPERFIHPITVRYLEVDQQGVVFNAWYLAWFDDAMTAYLADRGVPYGTMLERGVDVMLVHTEIDWRDGVRWEDDVAIQVACARIGRTSFTLDFEVRRDGRAVVEGRTVYVTVDPDGAPIPVPGWLQEAFGPPAPLRP